jgi:ATP-dependent DNA helicase RecQ
MDSPAEQPAVPATLEQAVAMLRARFGHAEFREGQPAAVQSILSGRSTLIVMPTGSGKSLLYQLPALLTGGLTLVVSPLIALMKDQVDELVRRGVAATFINSSLSLAEQQERIGRCLRGEVPLLYVAPERFQSAAFLSMLRRTKVARLAIDEAHCISEWGHDFRPDYRRLKKFREEMGRPPVTALTATATPRVRKDILDSLGLTPEETDVHVRGFDRPNFTLSVVHAATNDTKISLVREFLHHERGCGIIYTGTRRAAEELADALTDVEPNVIVYHAGMDPEARTRAQESFLHGKARLAVATVAFGMGIDKADVRFVLHYHYPGSVEEYYQQIGRAGRDGLPARCMLLHSPQDRRLREFFIDLSYPTKQQVKRVYQALWEVEGSPVEKTYSEIAEMCGERMKDGQVASAVRLLDGAGVTRAMTGDAAAMVGLDRPGAEILPHIRGDVQRRTFEALASALDLETPGQYAVDLSQVASVARLTDEQVRRAMAALADSKHLTYEPPFRGRGIEKLVDRPPPFEKLTIDWSRQDFLRHLEEEKLQAMENYIHTSGCRRGYILKYFGEGKEFSCGICDRCAPRSGAKGRTALVQKGAAAEDAEEATAVNSEAEAEELRRLQYEDRQDRGTPKNATATGKLLEPRGRDEPRKKFEARPATRQPQARGEPAPVDIDLGRLPEVVSAVLTCVAHLRFPLGVGKTIEVLTGSRSKDILRWGLDKNPAYGRVHVKRLTVQLVIEGMINEGYLELERKGEFKMAVLALSERGQEAATTATLAPATAPHEATIESPPQKHSKVRSSPSPLSPLPQRGEGEASDATEALGSLIRQVLTAGQDEARPLVEKLRLFHPREVAARLATWYDATTELKEQSRAVWLMGELCGENGLAFLVRRLKDPAANVRRLAASAVGKVVAGLRASDGPRHDVTAWAREVLAPLAQDDPAPQVRQYAAKALTEFPANEPPAMPEHEPSNQEPDGGISF